MSHHPKQYRRSLPSARRCTWNLKPSSGFASLTAFAISSGFTQWGFKWSSIQRDSLVRFCRKSAEFGFFCKNHNSEAVQSSFKPAYHTDNTTLTIDCNPHLRKKFNEVKLQDSGIFARRHVTRAKCEAHTLLTIKNNLAAVRSKVEGKSEQNSRRRLNYTQ